MLILDAVTKSLKIVLAGAVATTQLPVTAHYTDITTTAYTPGSNDTVTNSTTAVEFVAAPAASTQRHVESISVYNVDTASATVTIQYVSAGGTRQIIKVVLLTLEQLFYEDGTGWQIIDANGNVKTSHSPTVPSATAESSFVVSGASPFPWVEKTLQQTKSLLGFVLTVADDTASGTLVSMTAGEDLTFGASVYCKSDGKMWKTNANAVATMPTLAIAAAAIAANNSGLFLVYGTAHVHTLAPAWTIGGMIYAAKTAGGLIQDVSGYTTGNQVQVLGTAVAADIILFNPSYVLVEIS